MIFKARVKKIKRIRDLNNIVQVRRARLIAGQWVLTTSDTKGD